MGHAQVTDPVEAERRRIGVLAARKFVENFLVRHRYEMDDGPGGVRWWELSGLMIAHEGIAMACGVGTLDDLPADERAREFLALPELARMRARRPVQEFLHPEPDTSVEETP